MRQRRLLLCTALLAFGVGTAAPAGVAARPKKTKAAARKTKKRAKRMEKVGKVAYKKGRYDDAIIAFKAAYEALPKPKFLYNLARCYEKKGALAEAAGYYERYLREAPDAKDREAVETQASFLTEKLSQTMALLAVGSSPPGASLRIEGEGRRLDVATPWAGWLPPGRYELSLLAEGRGERTQTVALAAGQQREVEVDLQVPAEKAPEPDEPPALPKAQVGSADRQEPPVAASPPPAPPAEPKPGPEEAPAPAEAPDSGPGVAPLASFGVAAAATAAAGVFGVLYVSASGELDEAEADPRAAGLTRQEVDGLADSANRWALLSYVSASVAVAAALSGGVLLLVGGDGETTEVTVRWTW